MQRLSTHAYGLIVERRVDGPRHYSNAMDIDLDSEPLAAPALVLRYNG